MLGHLLTGLIPRPGLALIRPIRVAETFPGSSILLTENTREFLTTGQAELVSIGMEADREDYTWEEDEYGWDDLVGLTEGRWLLLRHRTWIPTDEPDLYLVRHEDIIALLD